MGKREQERNDTKIHMTSSFSVKNRRKEKKSKRIYNFVIHGLMIPTVFLGIALTSGCSTEALSTHEAKTSYTESVSGNKKVDTATYTKNLNLASKALEKAIKDGKVTKETFTALNKQLKAIDKVLDEKESKGLSGLGDLKTAVKKADSVAKKAVKTKDKKVLTARAEALTTLSSVQKGLSISSKDIAKDAMAHHKEYKSIKDNVVKAQKKKEDEEKKKAEKKKQEAKSKEDTTATREEKKNGTTTNTSKNKTDGGGDDKSEKKETTKKATASSGGSKETSSSASKPSTQPTISKSVSSSNNSDAKRQAEIKAQQQAEAERKAQAEAEAKRKAEAEAEAKRKAQAEEEARRKAQAEAEAKRKAEEEAKKKAEEEAKQNVVGTVSSQAVSLVNQQRANAGLSPLSVSGSLNSYAKQKAEDMVENNYFSHDGGTIQFTSWSRNNGLRGRAPGEALYSGANSASSAVNWWMSSSAHKSLLMDADATQAGAAYCNGKWVIVTL